jgi:hypothetical protein
MTCPPDITIAPSDSTDPSNTGEPTVSDDNDLSPTITFSDVSTPSTIVRTWTATDDAGNTATCVQHINIVLSVIIDIKPGNNPNSINLKKDKIITVAVLGSSDFDVSSIDVSPLSDAPKFGGATPQAPIRFSLQDVNRDGYIDLVLQYKLIGLGFNLSSTEGCITGMLTDGTPIEGCDSVRIVPP